MTDPVQPEPQGERLGVPAAQAGLSPSVEPVPVSPPVGASIPNAGADEKICQDCGGFNPVWFAPNCLWNSVIGGPDARGDPGGIYCPCCFIKRAESMDAVPTGWFLQPENPVTPRFTSSQMQRAVLARLDGKWRGLGELGLGNGKRLARHARALGHLVERKMGHSHLLYRLTAKAIEAQLAETQGSVHESAVAESHSPNPAHNPGTPNHG